MSEQDIVKKEMREWLEQLKQEVTKEKQNIKELEDRLEVARAKKNTVNSIFEKEFPFKEEFKERFVDPTAIELGIVEREYNQLKAELDIKQQHVFMIERFVEQN